MSPPARATLLSNNMASTGGRKLNIVVEGCCHGELPKIYASVLKMEQVSLHETENVLAIFLNDCNGGGLWLCGAVVL